MADKHWFDCTVGCAVAASKQEVMLPNSDAKVVDRRAQVKLLGLEMKGR